MCYLKALVGILLQTQEIPHKHGRMLNGYMAILSCSQLIAKHFSKKEFPLLQLQVDKLLVTGSCIYVSSLILFFFISVLSYCGLNYFNHNCNFFSLNWEPWPRM